MNNMPFCLSDLGKNRTEYYKKFMAFKQLQLVNAHSISKIFNNFIAVKVVITVIRNQFRSQDWVMLLNQK